MRRTCAVLVATAAMLAACTTKDTTTPSPTPTAPTPTARPAEEPRHEPAPGPMVIVTSLARPPVDLSRARARRVVATSPRVGTERAARRLLERERFVVVPAARVGPSLRAVSIDGVDPLRDPEGRTAPVVTMTVVGDLMLTRGVTDPFAALRPTQRRLAAADLTAGNLESTLSRDGVPTQGGDSFGADPRVVRGLRGSGFDVLSLANNHLGDFGDRALVQTVRLLRSAGLRTFGAGRDARQAWAPAVVRRSGVSFGFLGFNAIGETPEVGRDRPGAVSVSMPPRTGPLDRRELRRFTSAVRRLDRRVDVVVVLPHWGTQYVHTPEPVQSYVARRLVAAGADLVVGGHPHVVQSVETVDDVLVAHSLGNFVFDMDFSAETMQGVFLELTYWGAELKAVDFVPYRLDASFAPRVLTHRAGADILAPLGLTGPR